MYLLIVAQGDAMNSLSRHFQKLTLIASMTIAGVASSQAAVLFSDDFESGGLGKTMGGAAWGSATSVAVSADRATSGKYAAKFTFAGSALISDDAFAELRFDVGSLQQELWVQYKMFVPTNYVHRSGYGSANNKLFRLWGADYNDVEKVGYSTWPNSNALSTVDVDWNWHGDGIGPKGPEYTNFISSADLGKWMTIKIYIKSATSSQKGTMKLWKNGQLIVDNTNSVDNYWDGNPHAYRYGYLLGWSNSGFTDTTYMYIDDVVFATTESDLGGATATSAPPSAPTLNVK